MKSSDAEQRERQALVGSTNEFTSYRDRAIADLQLEAQGRHARGTAVVGSQPFVRYPRQPEASPWAGDPVPPEEPLGWSVEAQEPNNAHPGELVSSAPLSSPLVGADVNPLPSLGPLALGAGLSLNPKPSPLTRTRTSKGAHAPCSLR
jgi:hypothetical protein